MRQIVIVGLLAASSAAGVCAQTDSNSVWSAVSAGAMDPAKTAVTENVEMVRDRVHITLVSGTIQFGQPANGVVFAAVFHGEGRVQVEPPNAIEAQQLRLFTKEDKINYKFSDATFSFTDDLMEEVGKQVKWKGGGPASDELYTNRQKFREDMGQAVIPRLVQGIMATDRKRSAYFLADLKVGDKHWVDFDEDAQSPEEMTIGRWVDVGPVRIFDTWMSFPSGGRSSADAWKDPLSKRDFTIPRYSIDASVTSGAELSATTKVNLEPRLDGQRVLVFGLDSNLRVDSIKDAQGKALAFIQAREGKDRYQSYGDYVAVMLSEPLKAGTPLTLEFHYEGKRAIRRAGNGNYFCESSGWYPELPDSFSTRSDFEMTFRSPKNTVLVATGEKISDTQEGGTRVSKWKSEVPLANAGFAYGDYKEYDDKAGDVAVNIYANRGQDDVMASVQQLFDSGAVEGAVGTLSPAAMAKTMGIEMANTVKLFSMYFGPYPYKHLSVTSLPISYTYGQGWPGLIYLWSASFLDSQQRHELGLKDGVELTDFFRAHESSHQWWGHRVGWKSYHDQWLSEGFADFSGILYVQYRNNMKEALNQWKQEKEHLKLKDIKGHTIESLGPIWMGQRIGSSETDGGSYQNLIYSKGAFVLQMIRQMMMDPRNPDPEHLFKDMMQDYCKTFNNQAASTEDFKAMVEKHMTRSMDLDGNHKMDWFFNEYVYGTGIPQYALHPSISTGADGKTTITGELLRTGVADTWKDSIPIYAHMGDKSMRLGSLASTHPRETFNFVIPIKADKITMNDFEDELADVKQ